MEEQWCAWMRLAQSGDKAAYKSLLSDVRPWLGKFFARRLQGAAVDDLIQETMMTLHLKRHTYDPAQPFTPWLATVAKHRLIDYFRKVGRRMEVELDDDAPFSVTDAETTAGRDLEKLLQKIPANQAQVIDLVKLKEMTIEQAAQETGHSASSVKVMIHRGLKKLMVLAKEEDSRDG